MKNVFIGYQVYSVGVGLNRILFEENQIRALDELEFIAQSSNNFFEIEEFNLLSGILRNVTQIACEQLCAGFAREV